MQQAKQLRKSQSGMVAVMVTLIMMIVISLIVLGFAQVTRRAQRNALDSQLSTQAFYAAESGVNDAMNILKALPAGTAPQPKSTCADTPTYQFDTLGQSNLGSGVSYSCVTIDPTPKSIPYKLGASSNAVIKLKTATGNPFQSLTFTWVPAPGQEGQPLANCPGAVSQYPVAAGAGQWNCKFAVLRTELTPTDAGNLNRTSFMTNTHVNFFEPLRAGGGSVGAGANAQTVGGLCQNAPVNTCKVTISGLSALTYYLRVGALYQPTTVSISATDSTGASVGLAEVQAQISSTGKAQDVLRRILVAVSLDGDADSSPSAAIISGDTVCKRFMVTNGSFRTQSFPGANGNPLCDTDQDIGSPTNP
jgi:Tfp pilus assembly protein PilV